MEGVNCFIQSDSSALFLKRLEDSVLRQYGNSSAYDNGEDSDSLSEDGQSQHRRAPYNPTGYAPHLTNSRASASGAPLNQKLKMSQAQPPGNRSNPLVQRQGSGPSSPPQRGPGKPGGRGQAQQRSSGSGRPSASSQQGLHSPIKHMPPQSQGIPYSGQQMQSQHQQGPYEYQPPSRSRNSEATIHAEGARERKLNMLSQPTASSRARVTIDGNAIGRSEAPPRQGLSKRCVLHGCILIDRWVILQVWYARNEFQHQRILTWTAVHLSNQTWVVAVCVSDIYHYRIQREPHVCVIIYKIDNINVIFCVS